MRKTISILLCVLTIPVAGLPVTSAQQAAPTAGWQTLRELPTGTERHVELKSGERIEGLLSTSSETRLELSRKNKVDEFERDQISKVYQVVRKAAKTKFALIGAGVGAAVGAVVGKAKNSPPKDDGEIYVMIGTPVGAGIGALVGAIVGDSRRKRILIYEAR